ncbi:unnamed protein product [Cyprideis torosa]|uniref:Phosphatidylinositol-3-phosphatase SAC1 n=1 Tax=Cyprideis torosa TaxID=163714 RepID=A0A7R8WH45_9CRUS|nr:unnamed protein product [Cyprideis torosa]CAG0893390.1 unnamed protein product [Cyprideis torosa]
MKVHDKLLLHTVDDFYYVQPLSYEVSTIDSREILALNRLTGEVSTLPSTEQIPVNAAQRTIYGVAGIIHLIAGNYLIVISKRRMLGQINQQPIYRAEEFEVLPFSRNTFHLNELQKRLNDWYLEMVWSILRTPYFYFSYSYDLTHTTQRLNNTSNEFLAMPLHERADMRFVWNQYLLEPIRAHPFFCLPLMMGFVSITPCRIESHNFTWTLISRRSWLRAGPRLQVRGADKKGNVANYVETEQIVEYRTSGSSFVQTRGSIPLFWTQNPDLRYKPSPTLQPGDHSVAFRDHVKSETFLYGEVIFVNLVDQRGSEGRLEKEMRSMAENMKNCKYYAFDFHKECAKMQWHRLSILLHKLEKDVAAHSYFLLKNGLRTKVQVGVVRTNCIDCLDRTNVVQSLLARRNLQLVFEELEIWNRKFAQHDPTEEFPDDVFEKTFRAIWADNADMISVQYSGTGALKTDFTRTGKRTYWGLLQDGVNSAKRYYLNNFSDGTRLDAHDVFLGNYRVEDGEGITLRSPLVQPTRLKLVLLPTVFAVALAMFILTLVFSEEYSSQTSLSLFMWLFIATTTAAVILRDGTEFVDNPRLAKLKED